MDLTNIELDLAGRRARLTLVDASGERSRELDGDAYAKIESAAASLLAAIESTLGGACHLELGSIAIDARGRRLRVRGGPEVAERVFDGEAFDALTRQGQAIGH